MLLIHCYLRKGTVYIPTMGKVDNGYYMGIEPVAVMPVSNTDGLYGALKETFTRGNPPEPHHLRANFPPPVTPKYAGVETWSEFARGTRLWTINERDGITEIAGQRKAVPRGWENDPAQTVTFPPGTNEDEVIDRMIAILQDAAKKPKKKHREGMTRCFAEPLKN